MLSEPMAGQRVNNAQTVAYGDDSGLFVTFYKKGVKNEAESTAQGRPMFRDVDFVKIITPGDALNIYDQPVKDVHKQRFARQWDAYQKGQTQAQDGTPLEMWPHMTPSKIMAYKSSNVFTVEAIAAIADSNGSHMPMDWMDDRIKARAYLQAAEDTAVVQKLAAENATKDAEIARLTANLADLGRKVDSLMNDAPKKAKA
jgi:hypothetical protein